MAFISTDMAALDIKSAVADNTGLTLRREQKLLCCFCPRCSPIQLSCVGLHLVFISLSEMKNSIVVSVVKMGLVKWKS